MTYKIYILELIGGLYYVGISSNPGRRFDEHCSGLGAIICRKNKPVRIIETIDTDSNNKEFAEQLENLVTLQMMDVYGTEIVFGGIYSHESYRKVNIPWREEEKRRLEKYSEYLTKKVGVDNWRSKIKNP